MALHPNNCIRIVHGLSLFKLARAVVPPQERIAVAIPALIGSEVFLRAQEIRASGCHQGPRPLTHPEAHLPLRLVVCGSCNRAMTSLTSTNDGHRYYWCRGADPHRIMPKRSAINAFRMAGAAPD